uniref:Uncharacterized protein n=1 Tax=Tanacetum cinerariifolium TaxID=118510 RepID=A0A6L2JMT9_TANCI|nr:hypothetical protein [Tanacetum cinerariifolium]
MQTQESKVDSSKALDVTKCSETKSDKHDTIYSSGNYLTHVVDADIKPVNDQVPFTEVNSRAKVQSPKSRNNIKPTNRIPNVNKPERWISKGCRFSRNKSFVVHEKPNTLKSCLRWKPTGRIFKIVGLRWIPTGKMFTDNITKVDSEPPNGLNDDITNPYECDQTLISLSGSTSNWSLNVYEMVKLTPGYISSGLMQNLVSPTPYIPPSKKDYEILFQPVFDEYFNPSSHAVSPDLAVVAAPRAADSAGSPSSTTIDQDVPSAKSFFSSDVIRAANFDSVVLCCCGGGGRVVVVVVKIGSYVVDDVGLRGERPVTRTGVDSGGTEEDA